jgi:predicted ester cyclase
MTEQTPTPTLAQSFQAIITAITTGELADLDALIRYDIVDHNLIPAQGDGLAGLKYWAKSLHQAIPDLTGTVQDTVAETNKIAARVRWAGTHSGDYMGVPATETWVEFESFYILHFTDGLAVEWWDGTDTREALHQAGATLTLPSPDRYRPRW